MTNQPQDTTTVLSEFPTDQIDERGYQLLATTAQQAVLPRKLDEGIYAIRAADGAIQIRETKGYREEREFDWAQSHADKPWFVHRSPTLLDVDSFIDYLSRNTSDDPEAVGEGYLHNAGGLELWADIEGRKVTAILDGMEGLRKHTATLALRTSREWTEWVAIDGKLLDQVRFAEFIEDHLSTIGQPDGALLLDVAQTFSEPERVLESAFAGVVEDVQGRVPVHVNLGRS